MPGALEDRAPALFTPIPHITQVGADDDEEEEEVQFEKSIPGPGPAAPVAHPSFLSGQKRPMRDLPWSSEPQNQRARYQAAPVSHVTETYPMYGYGYGQEVSFSILSKAEVELKWTGSSSPNPTFVHFLNMAMKTLHPQKQMVSERVTRPRVWVWPLKKDY